jgi:hypothetical protein
MKYDLNIISPLAFVAAAAQRPPKAVKLDFFLIHAITTAHPLTIMLQQQWVSNADGHTAKFVRGLICGQMLLAKYEDNPDFLVRGDMWLKICHMYELFAFAL